MISSNRAFHSTALRALEHDDFGSDRPKIINVITWPVATDGCVKAPQSRWSEATKGQLTACGKNEGDRMRYRDPRTSLPIQRYIADPRGNIAFEPLGGSTVPGRNPVDTHTLSEWMELSGHGHLIGTGSGRNRQGPSLDINGNVVPWNSPDAHWPMRK